MPQNKPLSKKKTPPSEMLRVPTPLIEAVKELSRLHRLGHTNAVLQGLQELISAIDSSNDIDFGTNNEAIKQLALRLERLESRDKNDSDVESVLKSVTNLEQKLEGIATRLGQMEGAISILGQRQVSTPTRRQAFNYHPPQLELQPFTEENLAKRLAATAETIRNYRETKSPKEFESWCRQRDPGGVAWRYQKDGLYHPIK
ncbi:hypothetical protein G7B40_037780 [Aetokthonos hydrillicola Thurmond2011]|jgi:hypothetical protein|uniref:Uncharacterized protein n=1 Tax=Aetokthonos hydrillicola Thurmond2011 TaxID=2712845 RepID=A0AAP5MCF1_9CYAN|nr:hypothetical protein [Aetokthonos hydrillicola]MBO3463273.1 hypothetical protein [Aetokthonos hydrillicola CCALA 1050]MBW4589764.1 hypothetical protein [Aetokthonos hydrillicola CCALA 1050]MDR9900260.1 hypothetical protein [Aetokthonos hydrillicola Thurmond2011]